MRKKLIEKRKKFGYKTQKEFAKALKISIRTVQNIEQGTRFPREEIRVKVMKILSCNDMTLWEDEEVRRGDVTENIAEYMNSASKDKKYSKYIVSAIRQSLVLELKDRKKKKIFIQSYSALGKKEINERVAKICNEKYKTHTTAKDVKLYKESLRAEFEYRTNKSRWGFKNKNCSMLQGGEESVQGQ